MPSIACFISPHGFGHAARTCAILAELQRQVADLKIHIFTRVPIWFLQDSLSGGFEYHDFQSDIGLVQSSAISEDLPATLQALNDFIPFDLTISRLLRQLTCQLVMCDISPLGIAAAREAGLPSILIENFTWDWIYDAYTQLAPDFQTIIDYLRPVFLSATYHIQARPFCADWHTPDLSVPPIARNPQRSRSATRQLLGLQANEKAVLVSLGGIQSKATFIHHLPDQPGLRFIIPGAAKHFRVQANQIHLPFHTPIFHPDLVAAADAIVSKAGYSTIAEACQAGIPFGFVPRKTFREAPVLEQFILHNLNGYRIEEDDFRTGHWQSMLDHLLAVRPKPSEEQNGALPAAQFIARMLEEEK